ncbi:hypothetical protein F5884DRAFT_685335 [Xylogone sp. PMI_703]|nr:hypothetical protein F5884DRAFT_685335 [Xylogone sp. PMI_703]
MDSLLVQRRRFRSPKACYPCRRRKVKCDFRTPCDSCIRRGHPDLCGRRVTISGATFNSTKPEPINEQQVQIEEQTQASLENGFASRNASEESAAKGLFVDSALSLSSELHVGPGSIPNFLSAQQEAVRKDWQGLGISLHSQSIFEFVCLQNSTMDFPFQNLWMPGDGLDTVCHALPEDSLLMSYFRSCQGAMLPLLPPIINIADFEATLCRFIERRAEALSSMSQSPSCGYPSSWFGVLFSILACGAQFSPLQGDVEMVNARVFTCCSFQCLRIGNFLMSPDVKHVQALILLGSCLRNQTNAEASWSLLGLTIRLAQSLGMHCTPNGSTISDPVKREVVERKNHIWRALIWQDTFLSLCYDRPCGIIIQNPFYSPPTSTSFEGYSFLDSCHHLLLVANEFCHAVDNTRQSGDNLSTSSLQSLRNRIGCVASEALPRLRDISKCKTTSHYVELFCLRIFSDFFLFHLYQSRFVSSDIRCDDIMQPCLERCHSVVTNYLRLRRLSLVTSQLWILIHMTLSCALTLSTKLQDTNDLSTKALLHQLVETFGHAPSRTPSQAYSNTLMTLKAALDDLNLDL